MPSFRFEIRVQPGSSRTAVGGSYGDPAQLVVAVNAPAVDGKANAAVLAALTDALQVKSRQLAVVQGHTARTKLIEIETIDDSAQELIRTRLAGLVAANA